MELPEHISIEYLKSWNNEALALSGDAVQRIAHNRAYLDDILKKGDTYYGINTGFGSLCNVRIEDNELSQLQENLVCSHACGMGDEVPVEIVRWMLLLKVHGLSQGYSGVRKEIVQRLVDFYNLGIIPVVYEQGSLGASGDLAPLAHLSLPIFGKGLVHYKGEKRDAASVLKENGLEPLPLAAKEGLALLNGTQFMSSYATWSLLQSKKLSQWADLIGALSADAFMAKNEPFGHPIHRVRPHKGQIATAQNILSYLQGSAIQALPKQQVQDPYSFRCMPQVHGATKDVIDTVTNVVEVEINSVTDNPIVFHDEDAIVSGGNFHGQPLALHLDFLAIAMAELANISERRTYLLISGQRNLPPFLAPDAGLNSGFMIAQYTAASIVSQNKQLCMPASVDSIVSSNGQEDHVSMGANAATKLRRVLQNVQRVLGIELLTAAQALDFRHPEKSSPALEQLWSDLRSKVSFMDKDRILHDDLIIAEQFLNQDPANWINK
ncbi:histidine ammonia-lyase [Taibaiella soli]|uniref:Histidine ammonia-lyase n=1 Tax=Taibaiella soli TaxID=1649169 RepID=A0A2W2AKP1_9BACT|nr:histidine ammonia-lyase [Taibaiella soli]PZF72840.1 histidine ammonia-lyase [Taibaiella soli]